jgi:hypothetical protein
MKRNIPYSVLFAALLGLCLYNSAASDQTAITQNGKRVLLKDDGTWEYAEKHLEQDSFCDFRKTKWGMNKAQVMKVEKGKPAADEKDMLC